MIWVLRFLQRTFHHWVRLWFLWANWRWGALIPTGNKTKQLGRSTRKLLSNDQSVCAQWGNFGGLLEGQVRQKHGVQLDWPLSGRQHAKKHKISQDIGISLSFFASRERASEEGLENQGGWCVYSVSYTSYRIWYLRWSIWNFIISGNRLFLEICIELQVLIWTSKDKILLPCWESTVTQASRISGTHHHCRWDGGSGSREALQSWSHCCGSLRYSRDWRSQRDHFRKKGHWGVCLSLQTWSGAERSLPTSSATKYNATPWC